MLSLNKLEAIPYKNKFQKMFWLLRKITYVPGRIHYRIVFFMLDSATLLSHEGRHRLLSNPQGADPLPPSSTRGKAGRNHLNEEIIPLLSTGIGERYSHTISIL
jgi:hypothetical protein